MVKKLLQVAEPNKVYTDEEIDKICTDFNDSLQFPASKSTNNDRVALGFKWNWI